MRSGFCAVVGRPNVGKSTLVNAIVGEKVAITTSVPQTTRHAIRAVLHRDDAQVVLVDTPGIHKPRSLLGARLNDLARASLAEADCVLFVVDGAGEIGRGDAFLADLLAGTSTPRIAVLNKIDRLGRDGQLPQLARLAELGDWDEIVPVSAARGSGVATLVDLVLARMPEGPPYFPEGQVSDQPLAQLVGELIREKALTALREEVPHSVAVQVGEIVPGELTEVHAALYVERSSQKGIVIGKGGAMLGEIGSRARAELELVFGTRVYLDLRVKLMKDWQRDPKALERLGYGEQ